MASALRITLSGQWLAMEIGFHAIPDRAGQVAAELLVAQQLLLSGIGNKRSFDQQRRNIRRLQHHETGRLNLRSMHRAHSA